MPSLPGGSLEGGAMGFFPGESLARLPGWLRKAEGGATLIPCPLGFGRLDIFSRFTTGTKRLHMERGCRLGGGGRLGPGLEPRAISLPSPGPCVGSCRGAGHGKGDPPPWGDGKGAVPIAPQPPPPGSPPPWSYGPGWSRGGGGEPPAFPHQRLSFWVFSGGWWPRLRDPWPFSLEEVLVEPEAL